MATFAQSSVLTIEYRPLADSSNNIRLLRFKDPGPLNLYMELQECRLTEVNKRFIAISHRWGSLTKPLKINERAYVIPQGLMQLLCQLQHEEASWKKIVPSFEGFWIDAICNNQDDSDQNKAEKENQLRLMSRIYQSAASSLVVLGDGGYDNVLQVAMSYLGNGSARHLDLQLQTQSSNQLSTFNFPLVLRSLEELFCLPYFSRVWILQEVILSESILVLYGSRIVEWKELQTLCSKIYGLSLPFVRLSTEHRNWVGRMMGTPAYAVICEWGAFRINPRKQSIVYLIDRFCTWRSTEYEDRVLGFAGLCYEKLPTGEADKTRLYHNIVSQVNQQRNNNAVVEGFSDFSRLLWRLLKCPGPPPPIIPKSLIEPVTAPWSTRPPPPTPAQIAPPPMLLSNARAPLDKPSPIGIGHQTVCFTLPGPLNQQFKPHAVNRPPATHAPMRPPPAWGASAANRGPIG
ncbi:hypothetical protein NUW58_g9186 [Xylaria curta]|uniref:Uncharacterized protein n=1 Tax=Xylaria curta TaxID=42375 RepID=A0ACC1MZK2_9PEZI|nr:hypothetical protein NUW58_g9186 [Xylaria curta]